MIEIEENNSSESSSSSQECSFSIDELTDLSEDNEYLASVSDSSFDGTDGFKNLASI